MPQRRDWTQYNGEVARSSRRPSSFARWVADQLEGTPRVLDIGSGSSVDLRHYDAHGCKAIGYDYAHPGKHALGGRSMELPSRARRRTVNLLDERDVLVTGAIAARQSGQSVVTARRLLEALPPQARDNFWRFASMALSAGGRAYVEGVSRSPRACRRHQEETGSPRLWPVDPVDLMGPIRAAGGRVV